MLTTATKMRFHNRTHADLTFVVGSHSRSHPSLSSHRRIGEQVPRQTGDPNGSCRLIRLRSGRLTVITRSHRIKFDWLVGLESIEDRHKCRDLLLSAPHNIIIKGLQPCQNPRVWSRSDSARVLFLTGPPIHAAPSLETLPALE